MTDVRKAPAPKRPLLRWHGGKWLLAPWIIDHFGKHRVYVEPFGGAASVLLRKPRSYAEVYNDLDDDVVNLFRVLRNRDESRALVDALVHTPFARVEFEEAYLLADTPTEAARRLIIRSFMGFGSNGHSRKTGFRCNSSRSGTTPAQDWINYSDALEHIIRRLEGVVVEHRPAIEVMKQHDTPVTLHFVDPPYLPETRDGGTDYAHELTEQDHAALLAFLRSLKGMVVLSGYPSKLYDDTLADWHRVERSAMADGARKRTEVLWLNPAAKAAMPKPGLFEV